MKRILLSLAAVMAVASGAENTVVIREINWQQIKKERPDAPGELVQKATPMGEAALLIENKTGQPRTFELAVIPNPALKTVQYAVHGTVRYDDVEGDGYFEMWNEFGDGHYFSRTLGVSGPMRKIQGTSGWREFALPFDRSATAEKLTQIKINLVLPGRGKVWIGPLQLLEVTVSPSQTRAWWDDATGGWVGGILGSLLGLMFAICASLASKGRARGFVMGFCILMIGAGALVLIVGVCAVVIGQPYAVYYPLLLLGVLAPLFGAIGVSQYRRKYADDEYRKMLAADAR